MCVVGSTPQDEQALHGELIKKCTLGAVEIGVLDGSTTKNLCESNPNIPVYGIDPIIPDSMNPSIVGSLAQIQGNTQHCKNFIFYNDYSYNVIKHFDKPYDYLFIDADHRYEFVKQDFDEWYPNLLPGGYLLLHDSAANRGGVHHWEGPSRLADQLIEDDQIEYITTLYCLTAFRKPSET